MAPGMFNGSFYQLLMKGAVWQPGQAVIISQPVNLFCRLLAVREVLNDRQTVKHVTVFPMNGRDGSIRPQDRAILSDIPLFQAKHGGAVCE